ncbi:MAG: sigma-54-dependent Fis family transcriptional regulator [Candidatus Marinimicrobia bacterium]|jgi:DNA-binding NtrC family response regulator|nr:sigma-54-dependent Fis family transcriptional regulator [Candidatus Neomarinimicrobiota bacterium]MBT3728133.1 sigma-54-dependent Fis family transcriptional regulator [Candidatus Neomarinimicrobiota bacterium]MBT3944612.1 sigma-54-dependent Fis family transcriptional regulator [Candidatus Neomarinimicrobiota bacterium]MBT4112088.1 sigma-54-dependent Fis family transcriptional regulator [Candidatus Neomarinimicrobiota bacterium]MBT4316946.1 sigma-54-dependent Fis family transcriptional regula
MNIELIKQKAGIIGESDEIKHVLHMVGQVADVDISVLINGESGTGKELISKAIHLGSKRSSKQLVIVNCGAIPEGIIESELFGHKKGAYTDANESRKGYFETADKGTIFLDEIGDMPLETQVKVLRVLETGEYMRVGDSVSKKTDTRVVAATNKDLAKLVKEGKFRQDLYYRLKTVTINLPPLRRRKSDIRLLVDRFALQFSRTNSIKYKGFTPEAIKVMQKCDWPGNVRELRNFVESVLILQKGERITGEIIERQLENENMTDFSDNTALPVLVNRDPDQAERELILRQLLFLRQDVEDLKLLLKQSDFSALNSPRNINANFENRIQDNQISSLDNDHLIKGDAIGAFNTRDLEKEMIIRTLEHFNNNRRAAAKSLDMSERTLYRKINDYGIEKKINKSN